MLLFNNVGLCVVLSTVDLLSCDHILLLCVCCSTCSYLSALLIHGHLFASLPSSRSGKRGSFGCCTRLRSCFWKIVTVSKDAVVYVPCTQLRCIRICNRLYIPGLCDSSESPIIRCYFSLTCCRCFYLFLSNSNKNVTLYSKMRQYSRFHIARSGCNRNLCEWNGMG